jgi:hypothetical protein
MAGLIKEPDEIKIPAPRCGVFLARPACFGRRHRLWPTASSAGQGPQYSQLRNKRLQTLISFIQAGCGGGGLRGTLIGPHKKRGLTRLNYKKSKN